LFTPSLHCVHINANLTMIFSMNIDVTAYGTKLPTQVIDLCDYASCPLFQDSTTSTSKV
jgi:hypothetical protein